MELSVVIPTLNAASSLPSTLAALEQWREAGHDLKILIADAGSTDAGPVIARAAGAKIIRCEKGRGSQLAAGGAAANSDWLLFLHADTKLADGWVDAVLGFTSKAPGGSKTGVPPELAAAFRFKLDDPDPRARRIEKLARWRSHRLGLPYGDQGLLISRTFYNSLGGFRALGLMEDVDFARRIGRKRLVELDVPAMTSSVRYRRDGWVKRPLRNLIILSLYFLGLPQNLLQRLYG